VIAFLVLQIAAAQERRTGNSSISLSTSKTLTAPVPGRIGSTNSFPASIAVSPDGRYAALLNDGYGSRRHCDAVDCGTRPEDEFGWPIIPTSDSARTCIRVTSWGLGLWVGWKTSLRFGGSITEIRRDQKAGDTGNGIAVYGFARGKVGGGAIYCNRTTGARRGEKGRDRFAEDSGRDRDFLSGGAGADFQWWP